MKFYHVADIHLGAVPDQGYPWSGERGREIWESFRRLLQRAEQEKIDLLLIAGDLFHRQPLMRELKEVNYLFSSLAKTQVVFVIGNHDYLKRDSYYRGFPWAENVHCLEDSRCRKLTLPELGTSVYGLSYHTREIRERLYDDLKPEKDGSFSVLLAHGGDESHIPIDRRKLAEAGFDYIALGHIHKPQVWKENNMAYAGALEPLDKNDLGPHGFICGEWGEGELVTEFVPWACRAYIPFEISSDPDMTDYELQEVISSCVREKGENNIFRVRVTGFRDPDIAYDMAGCEKLGNIIEAVDDTEPYYDLERLEKLHPDDMVGRYIRRMRNSSMGEVERKALYYGIQAMLGRI